MATATGTRAPWTTKKSVKAERGLSRLPDGRWRLTYTCGQGCLHREIVGKVKGVAVARLAQRRTSKHAEAQWCPTAALQSMRASQQAAREAEAKRVLFRTFAESYLSWCAVHHRGIKTQRSRVKAFISAWGDRKLDTLTAADVDSFLTRLKDGRAGSTVNRYRTALSGLFSRAVRDKIIAVNPVREVSRHPEPHGRLIYLTDPMEQVILEALYPEHRALFTVSVHTGLRWSEQTRLTWADIDFLTGDITVRMSKGGKTRHVPMNSVVRSILMDLSAQRTRLGDGRTRVFPNAPPRADYFHPAALKRARKLVREAHGDPSILDGVNWHTNRHTFCSRLIIKGVDLRSVQILGGWASLAMVQRYSHLSPAHLAKAVELLVNEPVSTSELA